MLTQFHLCNFKSYREQSLPLAPLTLLIGANASGKSNAIEAFRFLCWLAQGQKLDVLTHEVQSSEQIVRGGVRDLGHAGSEVFTLGCSTNDDWDYFSVELSLRDDELHISGETITSPSENFPLYRIEQQSKGLTNNINVAYNNFAQGGKKPQVSCTDQIAVLNQLASSALFRVGHKKAQRIIPVVTEQFIKLLGNTLFLDPVPVLMRNSSYPGRRLQGDCSNLSGVLFTLCLDENTKAAIVAFVRNLPEQDIQDINFQKGDRDTRLLELVEGFGGAERRWSADLLSDGTLRVLAIAAALLSAPEGSTVVIEEVDNGVHPSRARALLSTMREQANRRQVRLLLSTHNPALMDALPDEALGDVVFCYRDPATGDSRLVQLSTLDDYAGLIFQGPLGGLVTRGVVDRFVKSPITPEQKKQKAMAWLEENG